MPEGDDGSAIKKVSVESHRRAVVVKQGSGHAFDFSIDFVLSHMGALPNNETVISRAKERAGTIATKIRSLRERLGLDQETFAKRCGLQRPNVYRLEAGKHVPSLTTLLKISRGLRVGVKELLPAAESPTHHERGTLVSEEAILRDPILVPHDPKQYRLGLKRSA